MSRSTSTPRVGPVHRPDNILTLSPVDARRCTRKKAYGKKTAIAVARKARKKTGGEPIHHYRCTHCGNWHVGHKRQ